MKENKKEEEEEQTDHYQGTRADVNACCPTKGEKELSGWDGKQTASVLGAFNEASFTFHLICLT